MEIHRARVCRIIKDFHRIVDRNVQLIKTVPQTKRVLTWSVATPVRGAVGRTLCVPCSTITLHALALRASLATRSHTVKLLSQSKVGIKQLNRINITRNLKTKNSLKTSFLLDETPTDPCNPSPCGFNANCRDGICTCLNEYQGDPYVGCKPECVTNSDCPLDKVCSRNKCVNPCPGTCALSAQCNVYNHIPICTCPQGMTGNAFIECHTVESKLYTYL